MSGQGGGVNVSVFVGVIFDLKLSFLSSSEASGWILEGWVENLTLKDPDLEQLVFR